MKKIEYLMLNGNWTEAQEAFIKLNVSGKEFREFIEESSMQEDWALLGYYARRS